MAAPASGDTPARVAIYPGWWAVGLGFAIMLQATGTVYYSFGVFADSFAKEFAASRTSVNLILTLVTLLGSLAGIPIAWLLKRYSFRAVLVAGITGQCVGLTLASFAQSIDAMILTYGIIIGVTDAIIGIQLTNMLVVHWFERRRGLALSIAVSSTSVASIVYPPLTAVLVANFGWRGALLIFAASMLALLPLAWTFAHLPETMPDPEQTAKPKSVAAVPLSVIVRDREFWLMSASIGIIFAAGAVMLSSVVANARAIGLGPMAGASLLSLQGAVALFGKLMFGFLGDRLNLRLCLFVASISGAIGMAFLAAGNTYGAFAAGAIFFGICIGGSMLLFGLIAARSFGLANYALVLGSSRTAMLPLTLSGPLVAGLIFDGFGSWQPVFMTLFAVLLIGAVASLFLRVALHPYAQ
jgi:MFS family permease